MTFFKRHPLFIGLLFVEFTLFATNVSCFHVVEKLVVSFLFNVQLDFAVSVSAVPQFVVTFSSVGRFVVDPQHLFLFTFDVHLHFGFEGALFNVPDDVSMGFRHVEVGLAPRPELGKVEFVVLSFVVKLSKQLAVQGNSEYFRVFASHFENAVVQISINQNRTDKISVRCTCVSLLV